MVIVLALYPLAAAAALVAADRLPGAAGWLASSPAFASALAAVVLAAILVAAIRHRDNPMLMSAWLFFFCGEIILALGWIVEPFVPAEGHWIEEIFELVAFVPLIVFVASSPCGSSRPRCGRGASGPGRVPARRGRGGGPRPLRDRTRRRAPGAAVGAAAARLAGRPRHGAPRAARDSAARDRPLA
jgi:hypothetical protein